MQAANAAAATAAYWRDSASKHETQLLCKQLLHDVPDAVRLTFPDFNNEFLKAASATLPELLSSIEALESALAQIEAQRFTEDSESLSGEAQALAFSIRAMRAVADLRSRSSPTFAFGEIDESGATYKPPRGPFNPCCEQTEVPFPKRPSSAEYPNAFRPSSAEHQPSPWGKLLAAADPPPRPPPSPPIHGAAGGAYLPLARCGSSLPHAALWLPRDGNFPSSPASRPDDVSSSTSEAPSSYSAQSSGLSGAPTAPRWSHGSHGAELPHRNTTPRASRASPYLTTTLARDTRGKFGLTLNKVNRITTVDADSPAALCLRPFDRIVSVDGHDIHGFASLAERLEGRETVALRVERPPPAMHASIAAQENAEDASAFDVVAAFRQLGAEIVEADVDVE